MSCKSVEWTLKPAQTRAALGAIDFTSVLGELGMSEKRCFSFAIWGRTSISISISGFDMSTMVLIGF